MVEKNVEISISRLVISFGLIFLLGIMFAVVNGYYVEESGESLPVIVYGISFVSLIVGMAVILIFQWKISKVQLNSVLGILPGDEAKVLKCLLENNNRIEQNHLVAHTGYNKVRISRILTKFQQKGIVEKKNIGNTNLIFLKLK